MSAMMSNNVRGCLRAQSFRERITSLEKEANCFHLSDEDGDESGLGILTREERELGIPAPTAPGVIHLDRGHDVEHRTTIDRHRLTFQEQALTKDGQPGAVMMDGRCRPVSGG